MKIGVDARCLMDARPSGVPEYTLNLLKEMIKLDKTNEYPLFYNCFGDCPNLPPFTEENVKLVKWNYPNKLLNYILFKFLNYPKLDMALGADVFFLPHLNFAAFSAAAKNLIAVHDLSFLRFPEFFSLKKNIWHRALNVKKLLKKTSFIAADSENTKRDLIELCGLPPEKIKVIYLGVGSQYRKLPAGDEKLSAVRQKYNLPEKFMLFLGTVEPRKNVEGIIAAYNEFRKNHQVLNDIKLIIAGERGWKSKGIYEAREKSAFKSDIKFLGYVNAEDKVYLYNLSSLFVYPSFYEGFGLPPLEAMASGLPVITSLSSSLPEVAAEAAILVDPYNTAELAEAMAEVLTNKTLSAELTARGLRRAGEFGWGKAAKNYLELINNL